MTFGEQNTLSQSFSLLDEAFHSGINFFDSAEMYPVPQSRDTHGRSEEYLGRWIKERKIPRNNLVLATKTYALTQGINCDPIKTQGLTVAGPSGQMDWIRGGPHSLDSKNISQAIDSSLHRLNTDYIDLYQIHWPDRYVPMFGETEYDPTKQYLSIPIEEQLHALQKELNAGKIRYIGLSNETPYGLMKFLQVSSDFHLRSKILTIQNAYHLLCRNFDAGLSECCHHEKISLLAYSPMAMGLLSGKYLSENGGPSDARLNLFKGRYSEGESRYKLSKPVVKAAIEEYVRIAEKYCITPASLAIAFVLNNPLVASAVFGATKLFQLKEVIKASYVNLSRDIISEINDVHLRYPNPCP